MIGRSLMRRRLTIAAVIVPLLFISFGVALARQGDDPDAVAVAWSCDNAAQLATGAGHEEHDAHLDLPASGQATSAEFDQLYIDMMIPHHASVIALAEAALPHLTDPWLQKLARDIMSAQSSENAQLGEWRAAWYGDSEPATDAATMDLMLQAMPVATMDEMMFQMDPARQVAAFCAADDPDQAFLEQTLPHHQMAVDVSLIALERAEHPELAAFADFALQEQQIEVGLLEWVRSNWEAEGTPAV